ncbi:formate dehydrogenase accessory protein FdhE [Solidesulfovibrio sp.]|uniref:formate dehydrogenase accessory protein FdhE n=1 Tax=Solidesulfovibrio sp. TaxID=2910990 RepID=UPI00262795EE|nr:formate dehydrogenase accessory protein FdhE [Solidesulfovibrio sp.]
MRIPPNMTHASPDLPDVPPPAELTEVIDRFTALAALRREIAAAVPDAPVGMTFDPDLFAAGKPLLADAGPAELAPDFRLAAGLLLPRLAEIFPALAKDAAALAQAMAMGPRLAEPLVTALAQGSEEDVEALAAEMGVRPGALVFASREALSAVLRARARTLSPLADDVLWQQPACPVCGGPPDCGMLKEQSEPSEFLIAKSGRLYLHCALCGHQWRYPRLKCVACGEGEQEQLDVLFPAGRDRERIHVCRSCGHYLIVLNRVESTRDADLDTAPAAMIHLDAAAQARGYAPICDTPWNHLNSD